MILAILLKMTNFTATAGTFLVEIAVGEGCMKSLGLENADYLKTTCTASLTPFYKQKQRH